MWGWCQQTVMFWWMALSSMFWGVVVVGIIYFLDRVSKDRKGGGTASRLPVVTSATRDDEETEISDEEIERMRDRLLR